MRLLKRRRRDITCREAVEAVTAYLDGAMSDRDRRRFERHLAACEHCPRYVEQIRATIAIAGRIEPEALSPEGRDALVGVFRAWAQEPEA